MSSSDTTVTREDLDDARLEVKQANAELESARSALREAQANVVECEERLSRATDMLETLERVSKLTVCDLCGDESNSAPNLPCGRVEGSNPPCPGVYRRKR